MYCNNKQICNEFKKLAGKIKWNAKRIFIIISEDYGSIGDQVNCFKV